MPALTRRDESFRDKSVCAGERRSTRGKHKHIALIGREHVNAGLRARLLLRQHDLASAKLFSRPAQIDRRLQWEGDLSVEILMQPIVIARTITQQQRSRTALLARQAFV